MATVGEQLKAAREAQRLTVTQVADMTKIRSDHIRAIDQGNYDVFSAPVYIRGFVRTYAMALKLDTTVILAQLNQELAESGSQGLPAFQPPASGMVDSAMFHLSTAGRRMLLPILVVVLVVGGVAGGVVLLNRRASRNPLNGLSPGLYQSTEDSGETLPLPRH
ncbi:MAG: helix-turn-helix domain-containing protein [Verrucomicrobiota bacterium]|jgi:cytoskeletal protein RodZ